MLISCFIYERFVSGKINAFFVLSSEIVLGAIIYISVLALLKDSSITLGVHYLKGKMKGLTKNG